MIPGLLGLRRAGSLAVLVAIGLSTAMYSGLAQSETCVLPSQHEGMTFPVEQIEAHWACPLQSVISHYTTVNKVGPIPIRLSEPVYHYLLDRPPIAAALINRLDIA
ncbi:MAG: hypothetical protein ACREIJ_13910, partial [Nitrospiraceae bacterium]